MTRRSWVRLVAVLGTLAILAAIAVALTSALNGFGDAEKPLSGVEYEGLLRSGTIAGVPATLNAAPTRPTIDPAETATMYAGIPSCLGYWTSAGQHLLSVASATPLDAEASMVDVIDTELWDTSAGAASAVKQWATCRADLDAEGGASRPVKVVGRGSSAGVSWQYAESLDLDTPVHLLTLQKANVVANFSLPDAPAEDWRTQLISRFSTQISEANGP